MDLQQILGDKISSLPDGEHTAGLGAVRTHIEAAGRHFERGQANDESAFTDVIYRCNQAFEGSVKEAYRVLAKKDPAKTTPAQIETYLIEKRTLRQKVLSQFTNYRTEWRNESTHNYKIDFDEDEALLAITSVTAFAIVLIDQIEAKLAFEAGARTAIQNVDSEPTGTLLDRVTKTCLSFFALYGDQTLRSSEIGGFLAGFLSTGLGSAAVKVHEEYLLGGIYEPDIVVEGDEGRIAIELRTARAQRSAEWMTEVAVNAASAYLGTGEISGVVCVFYTPLVDLALMQPPENLSRERIRIIGRKR